MRKACSDGIGYMLVLPETAVPDPTPTYHRYDRPSAGLRQSGRAILDASSAPDVVLVVDHELCYYGLG